MRRVFRFAPSPNGYLHKGHALSALLNAEAADATDGRLLLRIEDIDQTRSRTGFIDAIFEDLAWLGLTWETPVLFQSERFDLYERVRRDLEERGLLYPSFLSRAESVLAAAERGPDWPRDPNGQPHYAGPEREWSQKKRAAALRSGQPFAWRLDMARAAREAGPLSANITDRPGGTSSRTLSVAPLEWGDIVLARKDVPASYHLCVTVDDAAQGVTDVVRGRDLEWASGIHRLLQALLGLPAPLYHHHRLILDETGQKLSKTKGSQPIRALREQGVDPGQLKSELLSEKAVNGSSRVETGGPLPT